MPLILPAIKEILPKKPAVLIFLCCVLSCVRAVTLKELQDAAVRHSALTEASRNSVLAAELEREFDAGLARPRLSAYEQPEFNGRIDNITGVQVNFDLPRIKSGFARLSLLNLDKARLSRQMSEAEIRRRVAREYLELYVLTRRSALQDSALAFYEGHIRDLKAVQSRGVDQGLAVVREEVQADNVRLGKNGTNVKIKTELALLKSLTGAALDHKSFGFEDVGTVDTAQVHAEVPGAPEVVKGSSIDSLEATLDTAILSTPFCRQRRLEAAMAEETARQDRYAYLPVLQAGAELNTTYSSDYRIFGGVSFDISGFLWRKTEYGRLACEAKSQRAAGEEDIRAFTQGVKQLAAEVENAQYNYYQGLGNVRKAREASTLGSDLYRKGRITQTDLFDIYSQYIEANEKMLDACHDYLVGKSDLTCVLQGGALP
jgi:outer membrane protein TolC